MALHEQMFYQAMLGIRARGVPYPFPWWVQQCFRRWIEEYDKDLFDSKEAAFSSNALYRYWNMVGVKDHPQESLVGQAGEVEPVQDQYGMSFFVFDPQLRSLHFPEILEANASSASGRPLSQAMASAYLPVVVTTFRPPTGVEIEERVLATTIGVRQRSVVLCRLLARAGQSSSREGWLCLAVTAAGPSGFQRHDRAGRYREDGRIAFLRYLPEERRVEVNSRWGPVFDSGPSVFGVYGNPDSSHDPQLYVDNNPFVDLVRTGTLNGVTSSSDHVGGLCSAVFAWPFSLSAANPTFALDLRLPVDDYRGPNDLAELRSVAADDLEASNRSYWEKKLDESGPQFRLPPLVAHLWNLFRLCRANLLILADEGAIHPGPTIYDSFWVRDSSVEGIACALQGDSGLAERQFGFHYRRVFNSGFEPLGPVNEHGFFGGDHERSAHEWDSNGEALWAFGRFDRVQGSANAFGASMFSPFVLEGARWIRDNRSSFGLLHSGWSAEHLGEMDKPHYWDDFWGVAGLYEAARLAERLRAPETTELWAAYDDLRRATADSIHWVLEEQRRRGLWETFIPTGPGDVGRLDSTMIGTAAYFHPCRLHVGRKLGDEVDWAARMTLETMWAHFMDGGYRHDAAWGAYAPYLTLQLAHALLYIGQIERMDACLAWCVGNAAYSTVSRRDGDTINRWDVVRGSWNEQHCYPIATDFARVPDHWWYMGDIPHGWAAAEFNLLMRDILFLETDEDGERGIYLAPGVMPHWVADGQTLSVKGAPTFFGAPFGFSLTRQDQAKAVSIEITEPIADVALTYPCRFGAGVAAATADGQPATVTGNEVHLPPGTTRASVTYR